MDINMFKLPKSKYNKNVVEKIINDVEEQLKRNVGALHLAISKDNSTYSETEGYSKLISTINNIRKEDWIMDKTSNTTVYEGIGNIAVVASCQPEICLYMLLKALKLTIMLCFLWKIEYMILQKK